MRTCISNRSAIMSRVLGILAVLVVLTGCGTPSTEAIIAPSPTATPEQPSASDVAQAPTLAPSSTATASPTPTDTPMPPTATPIPPTATPVPPTATPIPPTATPVPPTATPIPPTATPIPPTATPIPPTATPTRKPTPTPTETPSETGNSDGMLGDLPGSGAASYGTSGMPGGSGPCVSQGEQRICIEPNTQVGKRGTTFRFILTGFRAGQSLVLKIYRARDCSDEFIKTCYDQVASVRTARTNASGETIYKLRTYKSDIPGDYTVLVGNVGISFAITK